MTDSIISMLESVKAALKEDSGASVYCMTPDVEICFTGY